MSLGRRQQETQEMWVATTSLPKSPGHVFYDKLNRLLAEHGFEQMVEQRCALSHAAHRGRPSIPPGIYFRMLLIGYFEGINSQRGIAWRCADSLSLRSSLGLSATDEWPDHSSLTRIRKRLALEVHEKVFEFVLQIAAAKKFLLRNRQFEVNKKDALLCSGYLITTLTRSTRMRRKRERNVEFAGCDDRRPRRPCRNSRKQDTPLSSRKWFVTRGA